MKILPVVLLLGLFFVSCRQGLHLGGSGPQQTAREAQGLNGPVRSVFIATAVPVDKGGQWEPGQPQPVSFAAYDVKGRRTEQEFYTAIDAPGGKSVFRYDAQGNETEEIRYTADGTPAGRTVFTYDPQGHRTASLSYTADGTLTSRTVFTCDAQGNETSAVRYTAAGARENETVSTYDAEGNLAEVAWYTADGTLGGKQVYTHASRGNLTASVYYAYNPDGTLISRTDSTYNVRGNLTEMVWYNADGALKRTETSTYEFDAFGNWIKQTTAKWVTTGGASHIEPPVVTYRTLTYHGKGTE